MKKLPKTEKILLSFIGILILAIVVSVLVSNGSLSTTYADESSGSSEASNGDDEVSTPSVDEVSTPSIDEVSTPSVDEVSTPSVDEVSTPSIDEVSTPSVVSEVSVDEKSVRSGVNIEDIDVSEFIPVGDDVVIVFEDEKLFFIIPVKIEKKLLLDESGMVVDVQQTLLSLILSWLSF